MKEPGECGNGDEWNGDVNGEVWLSGEAVGCALVGDGVVSDASVCDGFVVANSV